MTPKLQDLIARAKQQARNGDDESAMSLANELVVQYPNETRVWSLRAYLHRRNSNCAGAVADLTRAIEINATERGEQALDPAGLIAIDLLLNRGADEFALGNNQSAIKDFSKGLDLCDRYKSDDYRETLLFWRAEALLRVGKSRSALSDLARVRDGFSFWTYKLRTKEDLLADGKKGGKEE